MSQHYLLDSAPAFLAVNGTLMRGLELNGNLLRAGGRFVRAVEITRHGGRREYLSARNR